MEKSKNFSFDKVFRAKDYSYVTVYGSETVECPTLQSLETAIRDTHGKSLRELLFAQKLY